MSIQSVGRFVLAGSVAAGLAMPVSAFSAPDDEIAEIVVTARKAEETLFDIPVSVTALSEKTLFDADIESLTDVAKLSPGLHFEGFISSPGRFENNPTFRGITVNTISPTRQTASVFIDGAYVSGGPPSVAPSSIERIEVIRGPQAAVFGRTTFAGAVNYVLRKPADELRGSVTATVATDDDYRIDGVVEGPLVEDALSGRLNAFFHSKDGQYISLADGARLGNEETSDISGALYYDQGGIWTSKVGLAYSVIDDGPPAVSQAGLNDTNCGPFPPGTKRYFCGDVPVNPPSLNTTPFPYGLKQALAKVQQIVGPFRDEFGLYREVYRTNWTNTWAIPDTSLKVDSVTSFNREEANYIADGDNTGDDAWVIAAQRKFEDFSQELRLSGALADDRMTWMVGANYLSLDYTFHNNQFFTVVPAGPLPAYGNLGNNLADKEEIETTGWFGSLRYLIVDGWSVGFEGRYQKDEITSIPGGGASLSASFYKFLPRVTTDWEINEQTMVYASFSQGNLPGGFNTSVATLTPAQAAELAVVAPGAKVAYDEETLTQYEIGLRNRLLENRLTTNLALFQMERKDQIYRQSFVLTGSGPPPKIVNAFTNSGRTEIWGVEFEGGYQVTDIISLGATLTWTDSIMKKYESGDYAAIYGSADASGHRTPLFPKLMGSLSLSVDKPIKGDLSAFGRADWFYTGERYLSEDSLATLPEANEVNLRAGIATDRYRLEAFVTNLLDEDAPVGGDRTLDLSFATPQLNFSTPAAVTTMRDERRYGVRVTFNF